MRADRRKDEIEREPRAVDEHARAPANLSQRKTPLRGFALQSSINDIGILGDRGDTADGNLFDQPLHRPDWQPAAAIRLHIW